MSGPRLQSEDEEYFEKPGAPGTSIKFAGGKPFRRYLLHYAIGLTGLFMLMGAVGGILLPNQVQDIEFGKYFTGADAGVSLQDLDNLKADVDEGVVTPSAEDQRLLDKFEDFDAGRARSLSIVQSVALFLTMFVQPLAGVLSDRTRSKWGRRAPWIAGGAVIGALLLIGLRNSSTIALMAACWAGAQLFINVCIVPMTASVADRVSEKKIGAASAISGLGAMFGAALGAVGAGVLFSSMGLDTYYPFAVILVVLPVLFVLAQRDETSMDLEVPPISWSDLLKSFVIPLRDRDFRWVWIAKVAMMFGYSISILYSIYMMQSYIRPSLSAEEATRTAPLLQVAALPCMLVAMVVAGRWSDRVRRRKPFVFWASILMALSMLVPLVWPSLPALFIQAVVSGIALGTFIVVDQALFIEVIPDKSFAGRDLGMSTLASNLGQGIGPVVSGQIVALAGGYRGIWVMAAAVVVVAAIAITPVKRAR